jgi:hypothetical protein
MHVGARKKAQPLRLRLFIYSLLPEYQTEQGKCDMPGKLYLIIL